MAQGVSETPGTGASAWAHMNLTTEGTLETWVDSPALASTVELEGLRVFVARVPLGSDLDGNGHIENITEIVADGVSIDIVEVFLQTEDASLSSLSAEGASVLFRMPPGNYTQIMIKIEDSQGVALVSEVTGLITGTLEKAQCYHAYDRSYPSYGESSSSPPARSGGDYAHDKWGNGAFHGEFNYNHICGDNASESDTTGFLISADTHGPIEMKEGATFNFYQAPVIEGDKDISYVRLPYAHVAVGHRVSVSDSQVIMIHPSAVKMTHEAVSKGEHSEKKAPANHDTTIKKAIDVALAFLPSVVTVPGYLAWAVTSIPEKIEAATRTAGAVGSSSGSGIRFEKAYAEEWQAREGGWGIYKTGLIDQDKVEFTLTMEFAASVDGYFRQNPYTPAATYGPKWNYYSYSRAVTVVDDSSGGAELPKVI